MTTLQKPQSIDESPRCTSCEKKFTTSSHLHRHIATVHENSQSHNCPFCNHKFLRIDAVRRHSKTCPKRDSDQHEFPLPYAKRGRKSQACDGCRLKKVQCCGKLPCSRCKLKCLPCSYDGTTTDQLPGIAAPNPNLTTLGLFGSADAAIENENDGSGRIPVSFLLNYTDPSLASTTHAFFTDDDTLARPLAGTAEPKTAISYDVVPSEYCPQDMSFESFLSENIWGCLTNLDPDFGAEESSIPMLFSSEVVLEQKINSLLCELSKQQTKDYGSKHGVTFAMNQARLTFTATNLIYWSSVYFSRVQPQFPLLHQPTFDLENASLPLILAVTLCGSVHVSASHTGISTREFFHLAEQYIFDLLECSQVKDADEELGSRDIEYIQAALIIYSVQSSSNIQGARERIQKCRYPHLIAALRHPGLMVRKCSIIYEGSERDWRRFIEEETRIRLRTWGYVGDCMNTVFFNRPPQITVSTMIDQLSCPERLWEAPSEFEFGRLARVDASLRQQTPCLRDLISSLLAKTWIGPQDPRYTSVNSTHMLVAIFSIHQLIFVSQTSLLSAVTETVLSLSCAIDRWKILWNTIVSKHQDLPLSFRKCPLELCHLAQTLIGASQSNHLSCRYLQRNPSTSLADLHEFIRLYGFSTHSWEGTQQ